MISAVSTLVLNHTYIDEQNLKVEINALLEIMGD
jgi:hypothetical protein